MPRRPPVADPVAPGDDALDLGVVAEVVEAVGCSESDLIPILQRLQAHYGYLPEVVIREIARVSGIADSRVFGVVTFYAQFSTIPRGRHKVCVCQGTACHVRGGHAVLRTVESELGLKPGETSEDLAYSLDTAACLGACSLAPVMTVDGQYYGKLSGLKVEAALEQVTGDGDPHDED